MAGILLHEFFWFNTGYFIIMIASVVVYDVREGSWLIFPLAWSIERLCNGIWHMWWTIRFREYSPGLVSSILIWMDFYFIVRYRRVAENIAPRTVWGAVVIGLLAATFLAFLAFTVNIHCYYIPLIKGRPMRTHAN